MANVNNLEAFKNLAKDGGIRSRKLWALIGILAASFPLAWYDKLTGEVIGLFIGLYAIYCGGNLAAKQILTGGNLWGLLTSTKKPENSQ